MLVDLAIVALLVGGVLLGALRGALRQLVALGAWLVAFVLSAHLRSPIADWLVAQLTGYSRPYLEMVAFVAAFALLFAIALAVIELRGTTVHLSTRPLVDDVVGGLLMLGVTILAVASIAFALDTHYGRATPERTNEFAVLTQIDAALDDSAIVTQLRGSLMPGLQSLLGPLLPPDVRNFR